MGRPLRLEKHPQVAEKVCEALRAGYSHEAAAAHAGISVRTFYAWRSKGEQNKGRAYVQFLQNTEKAEAQGEGSLILLVRQAAATSWQAAMTLLERRWPQRWARRIFKPDDPVGGTGIVINFTRPAVDPAAKGDDLAVVGDVGEKPGNGNGGK
jgi:hypothetical protein